jgi:hypothetical protein
MYNTQNHWVFGLRPSSGILQKSERGVSETRPLSVLRWREGRHLFCWFPFSFLWLYSPILGLGRLHETIRFISVTKSRTVSRTPWTSDQLVARTLRVCSGWLWGWRSWWNERFWQGKPKYSEKTCPDATLLTTNPTCQTRREPGPLRWEAGD